MLAIATPLIAGLALFGIDPLATSLGRQDPVVTTIRAVTTAPDEYHNRKITVTGRFRGRSRNEEDPSLLKPLNRSRWDFVLQAPDAAIWISGLRPHGKDFNLDPLSSIDARIGRWIEVTGYVRLEGSSRAAGCMPAAYCTQIWIEATAMQLAALPPEAPIDVPLPPIESPPRVVFNDPILEEVDVRRSAAVRLQFSRDMDSATFADRVRVTYVQQGELRPSAPPDFSAVYRERTMSLEIRFASPLERFQTVKVELLDGITARDGQLLAPWTLTFTTGPR